MRKPSIFSKDYERQMKARKKKFIVIIIVIILALILIFTKALASDLKFDNLKVKIQTWIDSEDKEQVKENNTEDISEDVSDLEPEKIIEKPVLSKEFKVSEESTIKVTYDSLNNKELFNEVIENKDELYTTFNEKKDLILVIDKNQNMKIFDINSKESTITRTVYTAPNGETFNKDTILEYYKDYIWHESARFISKDKIVYISNMPYFGYDLNKYILLYDMVNDTHKVLLTSVSKEIKFNNLSEKGLEINLDGNVKYINTNGEIVN